MIRRSLGLLAFALAGLVTVGPALAGVSARVDGRVIDAQTKAPLAATLTIADETGHVIHVKTNHEGLFSAVGLEPGRVMVSFSAPGFLSQSESCTVPEGQTGRFDFKAYTHYVSTNHVTYHCTLQPETQDRTQVQ
jgi:hypothetical protein